jgi:hypothetical protein
MKSRHESSLAALVEEFVVRLTSLAQEVSSQRLRATLLSAFDAQPRRGPGRPPKNPTFKGVPLVAGRPPRPKQLCPVPGCKHVAAPVFGMVCGTHRDVPKAKIREYREARRGGTTVSPPKKRLASRAPAARVSPKKRSKAKTAATHGRQGKRPASVRATKPRSKVKRSVKLKPILAKKAVAASQPSQVRSAATAAGKAQQASSSDAGA